MKATPVFVFGEAPVPVFHRYDHNSEGKTACGRRLFDDVAPVRWALNVRRLRLDWAQKIGAPCAMCYPEDGARD